MQITEENKEKGRKQEVLPMVSEQGGFLLLCLVFGHQPAELEMVLCLILVVDWRMVLVEELLYLRMVKLQEKE